MTQEIADYFHVHYSSGSRAALWFETGRNEMQEIKTWVTPDL
jgi:hypothetical protein